MNKFPTVNRLQGGTNQEPPSRKKKEPVDTVRLKKDIKEGNKAVPAELVYSLSGGDVGKAARRELKRNVAQGDSLRLARRGKIPAKP